MHRFIVNRVGPVLVGLALSCLLSSEAVRAAEDVNGSSGEALDKAVVDFSKEIRPIFEKRCYECHGPQKQKSGLRLDRKSNAFRGGDSGKPALTPGKSANSLLIQKVTSQDPDELMPPKGERLTSQQIAALKEWIEQGASWPDDAEKKHWAYDKPVRPALPAVKERDWTRNELDFFVLARLEK